MQRSEEVRLRLPAFARVALVLAALLLVGMLATLVAVLISLEGTRSEIRTTRAGVIDTDVRLRAITGQLGPVLTAVAPLTTPASAHALRRNRRVLATAASRVPAPTLASVRGLAVALDTTGPRSLRICASRLRLRAPSQPGQVGCLLRFVPNMQGLLIDLRQLNRTSIRIQGTTLATLRQSLAIQRETLVHVRSIDDKTLGPPAALPTG